MTDERLTFCRICEALCGLRVTVEDGRVVKIRPDADHVATGGFGCVKGMKQHRLYDSPDRVRYPLRRAGDSFHRVAWDEALDDIGARVRQIRGDHGPDAIAMYVGTAAGFGVLHPVFAQGFMDGIGSRSMYSSASQDCSNKFAVAEHIYGFPFTQPFPHLEQTGCLIVVGANPAVSKWSFLQVPNPVAQLRELERRGVKLYFVDPRRTESARAAGKHVFIRPGTDVFFYLSFLHELIATGGVDAARVRRHTTGYAQVERLARDWSPERTEKVTRIPAATLREMVANYIQADGAALYCSTGVNMGGRGGLAFWIQEVINAVSGNLDRAGGTLVGEGVIDFARFGRRYGVLMRGNTSRVGGVRSVNDAFPGGLLADEILTPGDRQVKALFVTGGNPLMTMPNAERLREAFGELDLLVTLDIFVNETGSVADYVLPATAPLQRPDLPFIFPLMLGLQQEPYLQATEAVVEPEGEQLDEATIYARLAAACGVPLFGSRIAQTLVELSMAIHGARHHDGEPRVPQRALLSLLLRLVGQGSFDSLLASPHGRRRAEHRPGTFLGERIVTPDGKVNLAPEPLLGAARELDAMYAAELTDTRRLRLITRRHVMTHNSWTHNIEEFSGTRRPTNYLYMHPDDAEARGLVDGDVVDVSTETATVRVPMRTLEDLMPGTVALPHGWGHQHARGLTVAAATAGVNVNLLAADGPGAIEPVTGMARLTGIPTEVTAAGGPRNPASWSGLP